MPAQTSVPIRLPGSFPPNVPHPSGYNASPLPPPSDYYVSRRELVEVIPDLGVMKSVPSATADTVVLFDDNGQVKSSGVKLSDKADTETVGTLVGEDPGRSARDIAKDEVNRLLGDSPDELYDTFTEVAGFIDESKKNYQAVNTALGETAKTLEGKQDKLSEGQLAAANSGVTSETVKQVEANKTAIGGKVDKDGGKVLSDNNFTDADKEKLGKAYTSDNPPNLSEVVAMSELSEVYPQSIPAIESVELRGGEVSDGVDAYTLPNAIIYADRVDITNPGEEKQAYYPPWSKSVIEGTLQLPRFNGDESAADYWGNPLYDKSCLLASVDSVTFKEAVDKAEYLYSHGSPFSDVFPAYLHAMYGNFLEVKLDENGQVTFNKSGTDRWGTEYLMVMTYQGDQVVVDTNGSQEGYRFPWCDGWGVNYDEGMGGYYPSWEYRDIATRASIQDYMMSLQGLYFNSSDSSTSRSASIAVHGISFSQYDGSMGTGESWTYSPGGGMQYRNDATWMEATYRFPWDSGWGTYDDGSGYVQTTWDSSDLATRGDIAQYVYENGGEVHIYKDAGITGGMYNISVDLSWANNSPMPDGMMGSFPGLLVYYTSTTDYYPVKEARYTPDSVYLRSTDTDGTGTVMSQTELNIYPTGISSTTSGSSYSSWAITAGGLSFSMPNSADPGMTDSVYLDIETIKKLINLVNNT